MRFVFQNLGIIFTVFRTVKKSRIYAVFGVWVTFITFLSVKYYRKLLYIESLRHEMLFLLPLFIFEWIYI